MRLYLTALFLGISMLLTQAATVTGNLADSFGNAYAATAVQYTPIKVFQDSGSATIVPSTVVQTVTNGVLNATNFTQVTALYSIKILPQNLNIPVGTVLVPNSTNS